MMMQLMFRAAIEDKIQVMVIQLQQVTLQVLVAGTGLSGGGSYLVVLHLMLI